MIVVFQSVLKPRCINFRFKTFINLNDTYLHSNNSSILYTFINGYQYFNNCGKFKTNHPHYFIFYRMRHFLEIFVNVIIFHVKEIVIIESVEALVVEIVVAMGCVVVLMDGVVQLVIVHQIRVTVCQVL